ncbi:MAG: alpha/beta hydrolase [Trebonia sp.]|uniref:alpha/beta hydrolase n=3 Tax=Trebonia sp. TaxID=2767075 RepID=UPI003BB1FA4B
MPIHPAMSSRFPLLEGVPSMQALMEDPRYAQVRDEFGAHPDYQVPDVRVRSDVAPGPHGPVPVRVYDDGDGAGASASGTRPCLVWMHGGAFMAGSLDMPEADWTARELARRAGAVVVSVDYRLCNDGVHYPVPHDDVVAAVRWAGKSASSLGIDPGRVSVGGASAGANLAAGAALRLRDADGQPPAGLIFAYGVAHSVIPPVSGEHAALMREVPAMLQFPPTATSFFNVNYLGGPVSEADGYAFPALADLRGLCPTLVLNAEYDDLRASGQAFAAALAAAGVDVRQVMATSMLHGFLNLPATIGPVSAALDLIAATLREPAALPAAVITA